MYDVFYLEDPGEEFPWAAYKKKSAGQVGPLQTEHFFWHCLVDDEGLEKLPFGSLTFDNLPYWCKSLEGRPKHYFAGRELILEQYDGGFNVPEVK